MSNAMQSSRITALDGLTTSTPPTSNPKRIAPEHIHQAREAFSFRDLPETDYSQREAVKEMAAAIGKTGKPLDPILVVWSSQGWAVADGFLRLAAYKAAGWTKAVPVKVFPGSPMEALQAAINRNRKVSVALSNTQRMNAAWFLTVATRQTRREVSERTGVSMRQVTFMRKIARQLTEKGEEPAMFSTWFDALYGARPDDQERPEFDEAAAVAAMRETLGKAFGSVPHHKVPLLAEAIVQHLGRQADKFADAIIEVTGREPDEEPEEEPEETY